MPAATMCRFGTMLAHYHGNRWNSSELGRALGVTAPTINRYFDALVDALIVRRLQPWYENLKKRQVKAPKVYLADTGMLHALLGADSESALMGHSKLGSSWEGFAMQEMVRILGVDWDRCYYWGNAPGGRIGSVGVRRRPQDWSRIQAHQRSDHDAFMHSALSDLKLRPALHGVSRRCAVSSP